MDEAVLARGDLDERAELHQAHDAAIVELADLGHEDDIVDALLRSVARGGVGGGDVDGAVVVDVDLGAGIGNDLLDDAAALTDDLADALGVDVHGDHLGRILADLGARLGDAGQHDLVEDLHARVIGDLKGVLDDGHRQAVVLEVHLDGGDALLGTGNLEVHFAVEVLNALNVDERGEVVAVLNEAAGDTGDGRLDGNACVHQRERGAADGTLRGRAVGGDDLAHDADGIRELVDRRDDRQQRALSESAVADLAAAGAAGGLGLADGVAGEVIVVHIALFGLFPDGVELLGGGKRVKRTNGEHLRLAAGEQARAVDAGQDADFGSERTDLVLLAAVDAVAFEQPRLDDLLLELIGDLVEELIHIGILLEELLVPVLDHLVPAGLADVLVVGIHRGLGLVHEVFDDLVEQLLIEARVRVVELGLADLGDHAVDELDLLLVLVVGKLDGLVHGVVVDFVRAGLDHDDLLAGRDDRDVEIADLALLGVGVEHEFAVHKADLERADRAVPGDIGDGERGGGADQSRDLGRAVMVDAHDRRHDGDVVAEVGGEERADGAVDDAAGQDALFAGTALAAVERTGDAADGVELLLKVNGEGKEVDAVARAGGSRGADEHAGVAVADHDGGVGEFSKLADLKREGTASELHLVLVVVGELSVGDDGRHLSISFFVKFRMGADRLALEKTSVTPPLFQLLKHSRLSYARGKCQGRKCERRVVRMHTTLFSNLLTDTQLGDQGTIALDVLLHEIIEQAAALTDHLVQAAAGVVVLRVLLEVLGELSDALGEDSDLNLRRTGVAFVGAVGFDDSRLLVFEHHSVISTFHKFSQH